MPDSNNKPASLNQRQIPPGRPDEPPPIPELVSARMLFS
jgi:hypothetical protein